MLESHVEKAARFWDANRTITKDPVYWMAIPECRQVINQRVTGSQHEWPLDWFKRLYAPDGLSRGITWGCGLGAFERSVIRNGLVHQIDAFDISPVSLEDARRIAGQDGLTGIRYALGSFDDPSIPDRRYACAFFHASLHHVGAMERLFRRLTFILEPRGLVYLDEYVGPSRDQWTPERILLAQAMLDLAPPHARLRTEVVFPIAVDDPSEAIRSAEIEPFLREFCDILEWRPYGGQVVGLVLPFLVPDWVRSPPGLEFVRNMLKIEDYEIARDPGWSHHVVAVARMKPLRRLALPLARQVGRALRRRAHSALARAAEPAAP